MKILIADDQPANLKLLRAMLEAEGHVVIEAADGVEALRSMKRETPDAIISDILMPRLDGYAVLDWLQGCPIKSQIPVVVYTAQYLSKDQIDRIPLPKSRILNKSQISFEQLQDLITSTIPT